SGSALSSRMPVSLAISAMRRSRSISRRRSADRGHLLEDRALDLPQPLLGYGEKVAATVGLGKSHVPRQHRGQVCPEGVRVEPGQADGAAQTMPSLLIERCVLKSLAVDAAHLAVM